VDGLVRPEEREEVRLAEEVDESAELIGEESLWRGVRPLSLRWKILEPLVETITGLLNRDRKLSGVIGAELEGEEDRCREDARNGLTAPLNDDITIRRC
jgi:hypothetical protein